MELTLPALRYYFLSIFLLIVPETLIGVCLGVLLGVI